MDLIENFKTNPLIVKTFRKMEKKNGKKRKKKKQEKIKKKK